MRIFRFELRAGFVESGHGLRVHLRVFQTEVGDRSGDDIRDDGARDILAVRGNDMPGGAFRAGCC